MAIIHLNDLLRTTQQSKTKIGHQWHPARPMTNRQPSIQERFRAAWLVFTGRADALRWPGGQ